MKTGVCPEGGWRIFSAPPLPLPVNPAIPIGGTSRKLAETIYDEVPAGCRMALTILLHFEKAWAGGSSRDLAGTEVFRSQPGDNVYEQLIPPS